MVILDKTEHLSFLFQLTVHKAPKHQRNTVRIQLCTSNSSRVIAVREQNRLKTYIY